MKKLKFIFQITSMLLLCVTVSGTQCVKKINTKGNNKKEQPNVIIFAVDDMSDWVSPLGYKQAKSPNMYRLAK